ncbi:MULTISPECIES: type VI immunity family protein [Burkholderia cepacia complex]|uniref:type VI immunity family protein n=1 Tax=Burkholderia cepacia complex TaxID=87882 RepID=UPI00064BB4B9|nr:MULTISPECIES: type VI immunity family protein [Burkholderia cepacia complex]AKM02734.1 hypothetical protein ABD05_21295 [Burkholderia pyrrocinia]GAU05854.1 hypothetical protein BSLA_02f4417 [Burkholderia stabilis]
MMQDATNLGFEKADVALISPCLLFEWAMEFDEGPEILDFYRRAREALGDRLTHYNTGDGRWKPINKRSESLVATWCENPVPFPKKFYCLMENGADVGATASSLRIDFAHRPYVEPAPAELKQWRATERRSLPMHTMLNLTLPLDHPLVTGNRVADWLCEFDIVANRRFISGSCGFGLNFPINFPSPDLDSETRNRVAALMQRYPGFDVVSVMVGVGNKLRQRDPEFTERHQAAMARPYLKRANWLTFLSENQVDWIGGLSGIEERIAGTSVRLRQLEHGVCLQAAPEPQLGDASRDDYVIAYGPVAKLVRPVRLDTVDGGLLPWEFRQHGVQEWLDAFDRSDN